MSEIKLNMESLRLLKNTIQQQSLSTQPCYFGSAEGISSCHVCRAKIACDKSPEMKLP